MIASSHSLSLGSAYYHLDHGKGISSDITQLVRNNAIAYGVTVVEVDMGTGRVEILDIANIHDSGTILNPVLAEGQVFGGMSMGLGMALSEHTKAGRKSLGSWPAFVINST